MIRVNGQGQAGRKHGGAKRHVTGGREHGALAPDGKRAEQDLKRKQEDERQRWAPQLRELALRAENPRNRPDDHCGHRERTDAMGEAVVKAVRASA